MAEENLDTLAQELSSIQGTYHMRFANQPRITRDLSILDDLIRRAESVKSALREVGTNGSRVGELRESVDERLSTLQEERKSIVEAQKAGPAAIEAAQLGMRANFVIFRYRRHFAGRDRATRDLTLLHEMINDLEAIQEKMIALRDAHGDFERLRRDLEVVTNQLELFQKEGDAIAQAQVVGEPEDRAGLLGTLANAQFEVYRTHFAGQPRISRRPELLIRIIGSLEYLLGEMKALHERGFREDFNKKNQEVVKERLDTYRSELEQIRTVRSEASLEEVLGSLGAAANEIMETYSQDFAGQDRATRDAITLSELCDRMGEIERQMYRLEQIGGQPDDSPYTGNLSVVRDALNMLEREHRAVREVQQG